MSADNSNMIRNKNAEALICIKTRATGLLSSPLQSTILGDVLFHCKPRNPCSNKKLLAQI